MRFLSFNLQNFTPFGRKILIQEEIERNGRGPVEHGLGADSGADFHVFYIHIAIL